MKQNFPAATTAMEFDTGLYSNFYLFRNEQKKEDF